VSLAATGMSLWLVLTAALAFLGAGITIQIVGRCSKVVSR